MDTPDELKNQASSEQRLHLATVCLERARRERIRVMLEAHQSGLSIRQIASATGLSSSRVHQLLGSDEDREASRRVGQHPESDRSDRPRRDAAPSPPVLQARLVDEMDPLRPTLRQSN